MLTRRLVCAALAAAFLPLVPLPVHAEDAGLDGVLSELAPPPSDQALAQIPELGRKLLALRSYVRYGDRIKTRWSWTDAQIAAFKASEAHTALRAEIAAVNEHFKAANPGYEIYVHGTVRSLDSQITKWNSNKSVGAAAAGIEAAFQQKFADGDKVKLEELRTWLRGYRPPKRANLAAPGLTLHGRASAIDFQVMKDGAIYAGANSRQVESIWRAEGWDEKLKASIAAAGPSFSGPLKNPDEPWHYTYTPADELKNATAN
jgi:hypothetical protein